MRVSAVPPPRVHVYPALDAEFKALLSRLDPHLRPQRLVLEAPRDIHYHIATRQPALAPAVNVGVGDMSHADIAADVYMPCVEIGIDLVVMSVRLVRDALRRSEVDAARHGHAGVVVHDRNLHPVAPAIHQLDARPWSLGFALLLDLFPRHMRYRLAALLDGHGRGRDG